MHKSILIPCCLLAACTINKQSTNFGSGSADDGGTSGAITVVGTQVISGRAETDATLLLERVVLKSSSASAWKFGERPVAEKLWEACGESPVDQSHIPPQNKDEYPEGAKLVDLKLTRETSEIPNPIVTFYIRNTGSKSMTLYNLRSSHKVLREAGGAIPVRVFNKGRKLGFSYRSPHTLEFDEPISLPPGETTGIELELGLEDIEYYYKWSIFEVRLAFHNGTNQVDAALCYFEFNNGKRDPVMGY